MPEPAVTRLTISWSKDTDLALRSHLGSQGLKKGALSKFIADAVKWRLFNQTVSEVHKAFAGIPAADLDGMIGDAVKSARKAKQRERPGRSRK
jgi:Ribbon-helix-helix domain